MGPASRQTVTVGNRPAPGALAPHRYSYLEDALELCEADLGKPKSRGAQLRGMEGSSATADGRKG